jgi:putative membrane-bound dehydrogenase-like protein
MYRRAEASSVLSVSPPGGPADRWRFRLVVSGVALLLLTAAAAHGPGQGYAPEDAVARMKVPEGFTVRLVAAEPLVRQPVAIDFDDRGRPWVLQYLQYPNPAGLKRVKVDRFSRTVYDRVPEPPPKGPRGDDRLTILEEPDGNGRYHRSRDFVAGLNLASGFAFGHGGVFVLQAPYLLFYPDRDGDGVPDGNPEVLLKGFGMEDASAVANSLMWGPDGWLYGCQGTTVTANVNGVEFQQGVWRYHPALKKFELFCEGGGNCWGLDFDRHGELFYSTNYGGFVTVHGVQGAYYWKAFGKHGALHNPHAYGYFDHVPHRNFQGGHVTVGGIVYQGDSFPERFRGKYIAADLLGHAVYWHDLEAHGATFRSAHGGDLLRAGDTWFAATDLTQGPDGSLFLTDWYDKRTAHPDPDAEWDRSNGRVYQILARGTKPYSGDDLRKLSSANLVGLLGHANGWLVRKARRLLAERRDPAVLPALKALVLDSKEDQVALEALWALYVSGGFDDTLAEKTLGHRSPHVRSWTVRLLGDACQVSPGIGRRLRELAASEPDVRVRCQLACTAKRLPAADGLPVALALLGRDLDGGDTYLPLLLWWAVERHALAGREPILQFCTAPAAWKNALVRDTILGRLMRRYAAEGGPDAFTACARLLASAPAAQRDHLLAALDQGLQERAAESKELPPALEKELAGLWQDDTTNTVLIRLLARLGRQSAHDRALALAVDAKVRPETRLTMLQILAETGKPSCVGPLLALVGGPEPEAVQLTAVAALQHFDRPEVADGLLRKWPALNARLCPRALDLLLARKASALAFLQAVDRGQVAVKDVAVEQLRPVALFRDRQLDELVRKHWGSVRAATPEEKLAEVRRLNNDLRAGNGDSRHGREVFEKRCAVCHRLFGAGGQVGPDLTHANRKDRDFLLVSIVDPSAVIRKEYLAYQMQTTDGRLLSGVIAEQTAGSITLVDAKNERTTLARNKIEELRELPVSLMPEDLLKDLKPEELRDLFAYLQADGPSPSGK